MAITSAAIQGKPLAQEVRNLLASINAATAADIDINAANISLAEKEICRSLKAASATRVQIEASITSNSFKEAALAIAGV